MAYSITLNGTTMPYPKRKTPELELKNRTLARALGGGGLLYESPLNLRQYSYTWEPVTAAQLSTLLSAYLAGRGALVKFIPYEEDTTYNAYTKNWRSKWLHYTSGGGGTHLWSVSFDIIAVGVSV
jgi:hypothetical protein